MLLKAKETTFYNWQRSEHSQKTPPAEAEDEDSEEVVSLEQFIQEFEAWIKVDMNIYDKLR